MLIVFINVSKKFLNVFEAFLSVLRQSSNKNGLKKFMKAVKNVGRLGAFESESSNALERVVVTLLKLKQSLYTMDRKQRCYDLF